MAQMDLIDADLFSGTLPFPSLSAANAQQFTTNTPIITRVKKPAVPTMAEDAEAKAKGAFKTISETADMLALPQHVLRFWESKFAQLKPLKLKGGRRYYRPNDIDTLFTIKQLLYKQGYTIKGARKALNEAKRQKDPRMMHPKKPQKSTSIEDTPLFQAAAPAPVDVAARKEALKGIYTELLELKAMLNRLPELH